MGIGWSTEAPAQDRPSRNEDNANLRRRASGNDLACVDT